MSASSWRWCARAATASGSPVNHASASGWVAFHADRPHDPPGLDAQLGLERI